MARAFYAVAAFAVAYFWDYVSNLLYALIDPVWSSLVGSLGWLQNPAWVGGGEGLVSLYTTANYWIPVSECGLALFGYWTFVAVFSGAKLVIKMIPTVG